MTKQEYIKQAQAKEQQAFSRIQSLAESFQANPEKMAEYFAFGSQFYHYSARNVMLLMNQNPGVSYVDSYMGWKQRGANVKKGEKGLNILVPVTITYLQTDEGWIQLSRASDELKEQYKKGLVNSRGKQCFKIGNVFDISQTTFPAEQYPQLFSMGYPSKTHEEICKGLTEFSTEILGFDVVVRDLRSISLRGQCVFSAPPRIEINDRLESTQKLSTLSHELGHAIVHKERPKSSESQKEFEADAFSIMLCSSYGIELTESRKEHLAGHYETFKKECAKGVKPEEVEKTVYGKMMESFSNVFQLYKENADTIQKYVEKYVPRENLQQELLMDASEDAPVKYVTEEAPALI